MVKKYYSFFLVLISILVVSLVLVLEKKATNKNEIKIEEKIQDESLISEKVTSKTTLTLKENINIGRNKCCVWLIEGKTACGFYVKKSVFNKIFEKGTELSVEWITTNRVLLPCLTFSIEELDTVICCKNKAGVEIYLVLIKGNDLELSSKRNKEYYIGNDIEPALMCDLEKFFEIK